MARRRLLYHYFYMTYGSQAHTVDVTVSPFGEEGGSDALTVTSSKSWILVSKPEWIGITPEGGGKGITTLTLTAEASTATEERIGTIVVKTVDDRYVGYIHVTQEATSGPYLRINGSNDNYSTTGLTRGGQVEVTVGSKGGWHVDTASLPAGVTCSPTGMTDTAATSVTMTVAYPENTSTAGPKTVVVTLVNDSDPNVTRTITITQPVRPYLTVTAVYPSGASKAAWDTGLATLRVESNTTGGIISSVEDFVYTGGTFTGNEDIPVKMLNAATGNDRTFTISLSGGSADDARVDASVDFTLEKEPVLNAGSLEIQSASTTGNTWYSTNYGISSTPAEGTSFYVTRMGLYTDGGQTRLRITATCVADWTDKQFPLYIVTTGTVGSSKTLEITCTKKAKVAELSANDTTTGKGGGTVTIPYTSNDNVNVSWGTLPAWVTSHTINTTNKTIILGVAENTGSSERDYTFTLTTEHNGAGGRPVSVNVKLTQSANNDRDTAVTINVFLKQDGDGYWHYMTTLDGNKFVSTDTLNFTMNLGSTTVSGDDNDPWTRTSYQNTAGTIVRPANFTPSSKSFDRGDGTDTYNITYSCPDANITPYSETVVGYADVKLHELFYSDSEVNAAGTEVVKPTTYTVAYKEVYTNSFDGTRTTGDTIVTEKRSVDSLSKLTGTTQNTGSFTQNIGVTAYSRGTNTSSTSRNVATITGGTFSFSGDTYSTGIDIPKTITQQRNVFTYSDVTSERIVCGSTVNVYRNIWVDLSAVTYTFKANGNASNGATAVTVYAAESGQTTTKMPYTAYTDTARTWTWTSNAQSAGTIQATTGTSGEYYGNWTNYSGTPDVTSNRTGTSLTYDSSSKKVTASNLGATITTADSNKLGLTATSRHDSTVKDSVTFTQAKNEAYCEEGEIKVQTGSSTTTTEYGNSGFTRSSTGYTYPASGGTKEFTVNVTAQTRVNTATTYNVTPYTACTYDSGYNEPPTCGQTTTKSETSHGEWRNNYSEPARFWKATGDTSWFNAPSTAENSPITVTASSRGTTAGNARPNAYLIFDSPLNIHDEVKIPISQAANSRTCDGGTPSTRTTRVEKPSQQQSVSVSISASETGFKANGKTHNGNNYATITASETARTRTVTDVTTYTDTAYTCQWSSKEPESWTDMDNTGVTTVEYGDWENYYPTPVISKKASTGDSLSYDSTNQRVTATNLGTVTGETNSIQIQAVSTVDASKTDTVTLNQDINTVTGKTCDLDVSPTSIQFTDTTTSSTVSITSRTTTEYASEVTKTDAARPNVSISGDSQHFAQTMTLISSSGVYRGTVTSTYPSTPGGPTSPLAYVKYSSPDCPSETESVGITYNGPAQNVYPTVVGTTASVNSQNNTLRITVNFNTSNATPNLTWKFKISGHTTPIFSDGTIILTLTGKTNSMGAGVQNIDVISQDGSWYTDEFTLGMTGSNVLTITTPYQQGRTFTFDVTCTQQPRAI